MLYMVFVFIIIGLQESDTARIAGGNADVVAYLADRLEMYSYYGPSPVSGTFGIALLSRYPIGNPRTYYLYSEGEQVAITDADIRIDDKSYKVFVTHLGNDGPMIQVRQMLRYNLCQRFLQGLRERFGVLKIQAGVFLLRIIAC